MGEISENDKDGFFKVLAYITSKTDPGDLAANGVFSAALFLAEKLRKLDSITIDTKAPRYDFPNPGKHTPHLPGDAFSDHEQMIKDRNLSTPSKDYL